jgi:hypothetical protein
MTSNAQTGLHISGNCAPSQADRSACVGQLLLRL